MVDKMQELVLMIVPDVQFDFGIDLNQKWELPNVCDSSAGASLPSSLPCNLSLSILSVTAGPLAQGEVAINYDFKFDLKEKLRKQFSSAQDDAAGNRHPLSH